MNAFPERLFDSFLLLAWVCNKIKMKKNRDDIIGIFKFFICSETVKQFETETKGGYSPVIKYKPTYFFTY
jgi:hypothetical protein